MQLPLSDLVQVVLDQQQLHCDAHKRHTRTCQPGSMECTCNLIEEIAGTKQEQMGVRVQGDCVGRSPRVGAT